MQNGMLFAMYVKHTQEEVANVATTNKNGAKQVKMSVQQAHEKLGHQQQSNERNCQEFMLVTY